MHGDVFRPPCSLVLLSAVVGTGAQLALLVLLVILMAIVGTLYIGYVFTLFFSLATNFACCCCPSLLCSIFILLVYSEAVLSFLAGFCSPRILIISGEEQSSPLS